MEVGTEMQTICHDISQSGGKSNRVGKRDRYCSESTELGFRVIFQYACEEMASYSI